MTRRRIYDDQLHAYFVTFSCYRRRRMLEIDRAKKLVLGILNAELDSEEALCGGFVIMPNHVHAIVWFPRPRRLSHFMKQWKQRSSVQIKKLFLSEFPAYMRKFDPRQPFWQPRYYPFNLETEKKVREKLDYMHANPVKAGLAATPCDWPWSSARYYERGRSVGVPITWIC